MEAEGLKVVCLLRLSAVIPFNMVNMVLGTSSVTLRDFLVGSLCILPNCAFNVYLGTTIRNIEDAINGTYEFDTFEIVLLVCGFVLGLVIMAIMAAVIYRQLQKQKRQLGLDKRMIQVCGE